MKKTITVAAYNRPALLAKLLKSLEEQLWSLADYRLYIRIDAGGDRFEDVKRVALGVDFIDVDVSYSRRNEGINVNTYNLMERVYEREKTDWNVYLEDDLLLSPDAFNLVEWYIERSEGIKAIEGVEDVGAYCLCRLRESGDPENIYLSRALVGWGFLMNRHQWQTYAKPSWCNAKELWGYERTWDNSLADYIRSCGNAIYNVFPELSRVTNMGRVGTNFTARKYDELMRGHVYQCERKVCDFVMKALVTGDAGNETVAH